MYCLVDKISSKGLGLFHNPKKGMPLDAITLLASEYLLNSLINPVKWYIVVCLHVIRGVNEKRLRPGDRRNSGKTSKLNKSKTVHNFLCAINIQFFVCIEL